MAANEGAKKSPSTKTTRASSTKARPAKAGGATASSRAKAPVGRSGALAAGAARASGERAKRRSTPLLPVSAMAQTTAPQAAARPPVTTPPATPAPEPTGPDPASARTAAAPRAGVKHRPSPIAKSAPSRRAVSSSGGRTTRAGSRTGLDRSPGTRPTPPERKLAAVRDDGVPPPSPVADPEVQRTIAPGVEELLSAGIAAIRVAAQAAGVSADDVEHYLATILSFLRRRLTGDYVVDEFGFDEDFTRNFYLPVLRPLYRSWFRVEVRGIENIPASGGGLVVANHSGTIAMDSLMTQVAVHDEHPARRHLRMLGADLVFQTPVVGQLARKSGSTLAATADAERLLSGGELCGVWPEGFKGVGKPFSERYKLQRFGRGGFVSAALRTGVPIIPCSIVGAEEIYPIIGNMKTVARLMGAPYAPITPTWPLLGPLGLIPLPSKWIIEFGSPVETADLGPNAADDPMLVFDLTDQVRETIQQTLYSLLMQRRSVFF